jgi:hypothetical protein
VVTTPDLQTATLPAGFTVESVTGVGEVAPAFRLDVVSPSPGPGPVRLTYSLPWAARVRLAIYDLAGRELAKLVEGERPAGRHTATWDARDRGEAVPPGIYLIRLETPAGRRVQRFALIH